MAIKTIRPSKAPGPDGFSGHYYRKFQEILAPHLCSYFNDLRWGNGIPTHENVAYLHIIPKPGKDHGDCANYRPIFLINTDLKILTKVLAYRLNSFLPYYIHPDQAGFVPDHQDHKLNLSNPVRLGQKGAQTGYVALVGHPEGVRLTIMGLFVRRITTLWFWRTLSGPPSNAV